MVGLWYIPVSNIFHPSVHYVAWEDSHARTKVSTCCFDFVVGFCKNLPHAVVTPDFPYVPGNGEFVLTY